MRIYIYISNAWQLHGAGTGALVAALVVTVAGTQHGRRPRPPPPRGRYLTRRRRRRHSFGSSHTAAAAFAQRGQIFTSDAGRMILIAQVAVQLKRKTAQRFAQRIIVIVGAEGRNVDDGIFQDGDEFGANDFDLRYLGLCESRGTARRGLRMRIKFEREHAYA
jgi:hypothetical protein